MSAKLDPECRKAWETELSTNDRLAMVNEEESSSLRSGESGPSRHFPEFSEFADFLEKRSETLNMIAVENTGNKAQIFRSKQTCSSRKVFHMQSGSKGPPTCTLCTGSHYLWKCYKLKAKSPYERRSEIRRLKLCFNCFGSHKFAECNSKGRCSICQEKHHSLLHFDSKRPQGLQLASTNSNQHNKNQSQAQPRCQRQ